MSKSANVLASPPAPLLKERVAVGRERPHQKLFELDSMRLRENAKLLRKNMTPYEKILWRELRAGRFCGYKFRRQFPIDKYILDFFCYRHLLAIELDGFQHAEDETAKYDQIRTIHLESFDIKVLRFWNSEVKADMQSVLDTIYCHLVSGE